MGEDVHAGAKILLEGYSLAYVANAQVYHSHSYTVMQECKRYFDIGVFHKNESWLLETFGKAEGEGIKYIKSEFLYLLKHQAYHQIPSFFLRNGCKYLGYKLGKQYQKLSLKSIKKLSMHKSWWD
ncbi:MAG: O antigen biosynthesis rhamnosyltransferase rfbN [uncultured Sulfurovum sp.]|uniref:O antigen biosynthesis rhamnosyltransferase rfbN n=1 Tax=uncultured Sulfurovum sp. TaxID=269237 RepID=A0A6S6TT13_9BACT|nr:MAG: O antigen biosynthesis rhamnosyltransferase rfbN [uncultured Sulfurovum sp.]